MHQCIPSAEKMRVGDDDVVVERASLHQGPFVNDDGCMTVVTVVDDTHDIDTRFTPRTAGNASDHSIGKFP